MPTDEEPEVGPGTISRYILLTQICTQRGTRQRYCSSFTRDKKGKIFSEIDSGEKKIGEVSSRMKKHGAIIYSPQVEIYFGVEPSLCETIYDMLRKNSSGQLKIREFSCFLD